MALNAGWRPGRLIRIDDGHARLWLGALVSIAVDTVLGDHK